MNEREEWEQRNLDLVEEAKLVALDSSSQVALRGFWRSRYYGCPHYHAYDSDGVGLCDQNEMRVCLYDRGGTCELFREIIEEWKKEVISDKTNAVSGSRPG